MKACRVQNIVVFIAVSVVAFISVMGLSSFYKLEYKKEADVLEKRVAQTQEKLLQVQKSKSQLQAELTLKRVQSESDKLRQKLEHKLKDELSDAYLLAHEIYHTRKNKKGSKRIKKEIVEALTKLANADDSMEFYIKDYEGSTYLGAKGSRENLEYRDTTLEALQKVLKDKSGYLEYKNMQGEGILYYVKNLDIYEWFLGSALNINTEQKALQARLIKSFENMPLQEGENFIIANKNTLIYSAKKSDIKIEALSKQSKWQEKDAHFYYSVYFEAFDWYIISAFDAKKFK